MPRRYVINPLKGILTLGGAGLAALILGFIVFATVASREGIAPQVRADAIVVLTGGEQRLEEAVRLLKEGRGRRLLISGINAHVSPYDMRRLAGIDAHTFGCCVDLGYEALNTSGNALETRAWAAHWRYSSLIIVTSSYHMPRSLSEISRALPSATLIPDPVMPRSLRQQPWWLNASSFRLLFGEYVKFLPSIARTTAARLSPWRQGEDATNLQTPGSNGAPAPGEQDLSSKSMLIDLKATPQPNTLPAVTPAQPGKRPTRSAT